MCGRYALPNPTRYPWLPPGTFMPAGLEPRFNIAPSSAVPFVFQLRGDPQVGKARWGLVPFWADDPSIGSRLTNARADGIATKPSFRAAFQQRRGIMPAEHYYEWQVVEGRKTKQPWCIGLPEHVPFGMAALWERWVPKDDANAEPLITCCVITTDANEATRSIHHRMPVIIAPDDMAQWLDPTTSRADAEALLRPYGSAMSMWPVSTRVNTTKFDDAELLRPIDLDAPTLFP